MEVKPRPRLLAPPVRSLCILIAQRHGAVVKLAGRSGVAGVCRQAAEQEVRAPVSGLACRTWK